MKKITRNIITCTGLLMATFSIAVHGASDVPATPADPNAQDVQVSTAQSGAQVAQDAAAQSGAQGVQNPAAQSGAQDAAAQSGAQGVQDGAAQSGAQDAQAAAAQSGAQGVQNPAAQSGAQGVQDGAAQSGAQDAQAAAAQSSAQGVQNPAAQSGAQDAAAQSVSQEDVVTSETIVFDPSWTYGDKAKITSGTAKLLHAKPSIAKHKTVCVNAGHGTQGGGSVKTLCHPDGTPKVTGGTTDAGETEAVAVSSGTEFADGTPEAQVVLALALVVRDTLLDEGYDVLMIRDTEDVQLDNIARTLMANHYADCHITLHYDSTDRDKGVYYMSVPDVASYRSMEPVASHWMDHHRLGDAVVNAIEKEGFKLFEKGALDSDLTVTSYATIPTITLELGDKASDHSGSTFPGLARGIAAGLNSFFLFT